MRGLRQGLLARFLIARFSVDFNRLRPRVSKAVDPHFGPLGAGGEVFKF